MTTTVFCLDFDETLMNTDRLRGDLEAAMQRLGGDELMSAYTAAYETVRQERGGVSIPLVLRALAEQAGSRQLAELFHSFAYEDYLYPEAAQVITHLKKQGSVVILSDGDAFYQPQKIDATSLAALVDGIIIVPSKVDRFEELAGYWPADRYVFIDDKPTVLTAAKAHFGSAATTVHVRQGRYAGAQHVAADLGVDTVAGVIDVLPESAGV